MLLLLFTAGRDRYAIAGAQIVEVIPYLQIEQRASLPELIPGIINYRSIPVPIVDLSLLLTDKPCRRRLSTRIILTRYNAENTAPPKSPSQIVGLLAENVTESVNVSKSGTCQTEGKETKPYGGKQYINAEEAGYNMLQIFDPGKLLPAAILDNLVL